jgi:hypothetical protein
METKKYQTETKSGSKLDFDFLKTEQEANTMIKRVYSIRGGNGEKNSNYLKKEVEPSKKKLSALPFVTPKQLDTFFHVNENNSTVQVAQTKSAAISGNQEENFDLPKINKYLVKTDTSNLDEKNWKRFFGSKNLQKKKQALSALVVEEHQKSLENINNDSIEEEKVIQNDFQNEEKDDKNSDSILSSPSSIIKPLNNPVNKNKFKFTVRKPRNIQKLYRLL